MKFAVLWCRALAISLTVSVPARAQFRTAVPSPALGGGVDTMPAAWWGDQWKVPVAAIYHRWAEFLSSNAPRYTAPGSTPSSYWSASEQQRWINFPLALNFVSRSAVPMVLDIRPATPGSDSVYIVKTLFRSPGSAAEPLALTRVYAIREHGRWVFSNALTRATDDWQRRVVGPFEYVFPPGYSFNRARAQRAAAFADSLAVAFAVPKVAKVAYYLTTSPDEMNRIIGLDWYPSSTDGGAFSSGPNRLVVSGNATLGENYRHEIVHVALSSLALRGVHPLVWEGVATWLGGTLAMDAPTVRREYATYLRKHADITLESILTQQHDHGFRPAGAVLCRMVFERGGTTAVKALIAGGYNDADLKASLQGLLGKSWMAIQADWLRAALLQ